MRIVVIVTLAVLAATPAGAAGCGDWIIAKSGITCVDLIPSPCSDPGGASYHPLCDMSGGAVQPDNEGMFFAGRSVFTGDCNDLELIRTDGVAEELIASSETACTFISSIVFDEQNGRLYVAVGVDYLMRLEGFTTEFEILQTYEPASNELSFRVPWRPEGLAGAETFDTYYGSLAGVGDWSLAQPLACAFPATPPDVGDWIQLPDPLPDPAPGEGRYYVTAVHSQGAVRYGRQTLAGTTTGRNPLLLPPCTQ